MIIDDGIVFRRADEKDAPVLVRLYDGAAAWMRENGIEQWKAGEKDAEHFRRKMREGEVWLARDADGAVCGAYELWWSDEEAWGVQPHDADAMAQSLLLPAAGLLIGLVAVLCFEKPKHLATRAQAPAEAIAPQ